MVKETICLGSEPNLNQYKTFVDMFQRVQNKLQLGSYSVLTRKLKDLFKLMLISFDKIRFNFYTSLSTRYSFDFHSFPFL